MKSSLSLQTALLILVMFYPLPSYDQSFTSLSYDEWSALHHRSAGLRIADARNEKRVDPSNDTFQESDYRTARGIRKFTKPTILLRGTAEEIGLDGQTLVGFLETTFLQEFAFLQRDFTFDKTYETSEIGLVECEAWTVGRNYPIASHVQCTAGSMDEPRHWHYASLGYGPKERIVETVKKTLDSIIAEYATFVRKARGKNGS